jgi:hypothetical protein
MFRIDDLTHIVIVAGDSDYVALAQKAKRLGRYVVGIGVAGGTSRALTAAVDEFADYDALLSTDAAVDDEADVVERAPEAAPRRRRASTKQPDAAADAAPEASPRSSRRARSQPKEDAKSAAEADETPAEPAERPSARVIQFVAPTDHVPDEATGSPRNPGRLLLKAIELLRSKNDEEWQSSSAVKNQMLRMDPSFQERRLGFASFSEFLKSRGGVVELDETGRGRVRIRTNKD